MEAPSAVSNGRIKSPRAVAANRRRSCLTNDTSTVLEDPERKEGRKQHMPHDEALVQENKELTAEVARLRGVIAGLVGAVTQLTRE